MNAELVSRKFKVGRYYAERDHGDFLVRQEHSNTGFYFTIEELEALLELARKELGGGKGHQVSENAHRSGR